MDTATTAARPEVAWDEPSATSVLGGRSVSSPPWEQTFLRELARTGSASRAAAAAGVHHGTPSRRRQRSPAFAAEWDRAVAQAGRRRGDDRPKIDPEIWRPTFLSALARGGNVSRAAAAAGVSPESAWISRRGDPEFAVRWQEALAAAAARRASWAVQALEVEKIRDMATAQDDAPLAVRAS